MRDFKYHFATEAQKIAILEEKNKVMKLYISCAAISVVTTLLVIVIARLI